MADVPPPAYPASGTLPPPPPPGTVLYQTHQGGVAVVAAPLQFRESPLRTVCPHCQCDVTTRTEYKTGFLTWLSAGVVLMFGCWLGCCFIPFCVNACKDVIHSCPNCNREVGRYERLS